jgi:hypothetical protein
VELTVDIDPRTSVHGNPGAEALIDVYLRLYGHMVVQLSYYILLYRALRAS